MRARLTDWTDRDLNLVEDELERRIQREGAIDIYGCCLQAVRTIRREKQTLPTQPDVYQFRKLSQALNRIEWKLGVIKGHVEPEGASERGPLMQTDAEGMLSVVVPERWILVAEAMPEDHVRVLFVYTHKGRVSGTHGFYDADDERWFDDLTVGDGMYLGRGETVTHWRPFPPLPKAAP